MNCSTCVNHAGGYCTEKHKFTPDDCSCYAHLSKEDLSHLFAESDDRHPDTTTEREN